MVSLIPKPNGVVKDNSFVFPVAALKTVYAGTFPQSCLSAFEARLGRKLEAAGKEAADLILEDVDLPGKEAYRIVVDERKILIEAVTERGVIWALTSLYLLQEEDIYPGIHLTDEPRYHHRGFMLDCGRHYFPVDVVKEIIEQNAKIKLNTFHWSLTNDQGWRIESKVFPKLHETDGQSYYTQEEIRDIVRFAAERGVEVIPEINMPGHSIAILAAYPGLSCRGKETSIKTGAGIFTTILCAGKEQVYSFLSELLDEICPLFPSPYFHIGGDEAPKKEWETCDDCRKKLEEEGCGDFENLQGYFICRIAEHLQEKGKQVICWNDVLQAGKLPDGLVIQQWLDMKRESRTQSFLEEGNSVIFSDMFYLYLDYTEDFSPMKRIYEYEPALRGVDFSSHPGTMGIQACLWSERIKDKEKLEKMIYPRLFAVAEASWSKEKDYGDFCLRLPRYLMKMEEEGMYFTSLEDCDTHGIARINGIAQFIKDMRRSIVNDTNTDAGLTPETLEIFLKEFGIRIPEAMRKIFGGS